MSSYVLADFQPFEGNLKQSVAFKITTDLDFLALGQSYTIIGKAIGKGDFYLSIHASPLENQFSNLAGNKFELHPEIFSLLQLRSKALKVTRNKGHY